MPVISKRVKKIFVIVVLLVLPVLMLSANIFFDAEGGMAIDSIPKENFSGVEFNVRGYYGSQIQIGEDFLFESEFSFLTDNIFEDIFLENISSSFSIDKLSLSYNIKGINFNSRISAFAGINDYIGSDAYFRKYFGVIPFDSPLFEKQIAVEKPSFMSVDGYGLEISTIFPASIGTAFYTYYTEKVYADEKQKQLNFDGRFTWVGESFLGDVSFGASLPFEEEDADGEKVIMVIRRADLHTSATLLIGNNPHANLFMQFGVTRLQINPPSGEKVFTLENLHIFIEPRFAVKSTNISISGFMLPQETVNLIPHIEHTIGGGVYFDIAQNIGISKAKFGSHITASIGNVLGSSATNTNTEMDISVIASPFAKFQFGTGELNITLPIKALEYEDFGKMFSSTISYKLSF